jgi:hypothetical protein
VDLGFDLRDHAARRVPLGKLFYPKLLDVSTDIFDHFWIQAAVSLLKQAVTALYGFCNGYIVAVTQAQPPQT